MSKVDKYLNFKPTPEQQELVEAFLDFINSDDQVFILSGYAGTGKTSMVLGFVSMLDDMEIPSILLASTGRAAKVLQDKALKECSTIHRQIYSLLTKIDERTKQDSNYKLKFKLSANNKDPETIYFVDESSMVADSNTLNMNLEFGSGKLLTDFFKYLNDSKVVFIGDPAQLPPINYKISPALNSQYIESHFNKSVRVFQLKQVMRFNEHTGISFNTSSLRTNIVENKYPPLKIKKSNFNDIKTIYGQQAMAAKLYSIIKEQGIYSVIGVCYTNKMVYTVNNSVRKFLFSGKTAQINKGELLIVMQNNYKYGISNGEHVEVIAFTGERTQRAGINFIELQLKGHDIKGSYLIKSWIIEEYLFSDKARLDFEIEKALLKDYIIRMSKLGIKPGSEEFYEGLFDDEFLNALKVKFGYCITCHKAQGGEWKNVVLAIEPVLFMQAPELIYRWTYTAISRARESIFILENKCLI
ncbi:MAG: DEAD/DEAH box helicase [Bacteroidales bacterium]|nr:DEAD/DEAH box helicase [Bacteroidales bacterium]